MLGCQSSLVRVTDLIAVGNSLCIEGVCCKMVVAGVEQYGNMLQKRKLEDDLDNLSTESSESEEDVEGDDSSSPSIEPPLNPTLQLIERARLESLLKQKEMVDSFGLNQPCRLFPPPSTLASAHHPAKKKPNKVIFC